MPPQHSAIRREFARRFPNVPFIPAAETSVSPAAAGNPTRDFAKPPGVYGTSLRCCEPTVRKSRVEFRVFPSHCRRSVGSLWKIESGLNTVDARSVVHLSREVAMTHKIEKCDSVRELLEKAGVRHNLVNRLSKR